MAKKQNKPEDQALPAFESLPDPATFSLPKPNATPRVNHSAFEVDEVTFAEMVDENRELILKREAEEQAALEEEKAREREENARIAREEAARAADEAFERRFGATSIEEAIANLGKDIGPDATTEEKKAVELAEKGYAAPLSQWFDNTGPQLLENPMQWLKHQNERTQRRIGVVGGSASALLLSIILFGVGNTIAALLVLALVVFGTAYYFANEEKLKKQFKETVEELKRQAEARTRKPVEPDEAPADEPEVQSQAIAPEAEPTDLGETEFDFGEYDDYDDETDEGKEDVALPKL